MNLVSETLTPALPTAMAFPNPSANHERYALLLSAYELVALREFINANKAAGYPFDQNLLSSIAARNPRCNDCSWEHQGSCDGLTYGCTFCIERFHTVGEEYRHRALCHPDTHTNTCTRIPITVLAARSPIPANSITT